MTQLREQVHVEVTKPPSMYSKRRRDLWLGAIGVAAAAAGVYMQTASSTWLFGGLDEGWHLGAYVLAGLFLAATFAMLARRSFLEDDAYTPTVQFRIVLALVSLACAVIFTVSWFV